MKSRLKNLGIAVLMIHQLVACCWNVPPDFDSLPVEKQIEEYEKLAQRGCGTAQLRGLIAENGLAAAEKMIPFLASPRKALPLLDAIWIVRDIEAHGFRLSGHPVHKALRECLLRPDLSTLERRELKATIAIIEHRPSPAPTMPDERARSDEPDDSP